MRHLSRPGRRMTPSERLAIAAKAKALWLQGLPVVRIGELVGVDRQLITKMVRIWERGGLTRQVAR
jgi:hypothetical protein